jgi:hypothetical protein
MYSRRGLLVDWYPVRGASNMTSTTIYDTDSAVGSIASGVVAPGSVISPPIEINPPLVHSPAADHGEQKHLQSV